MRIDPPYYSAFDDPTGYPKEILLPNALPVWLKNPKSDAVVICLHGFLTTVYEVKPVAEALHAAGINAACLLLPAHGIKDEALAKKLVLEVDYTEWLESVRTEIKRARQYYKKVYVYGQSMGGALALCMAEEGLIDACATTAPAIQLYGIANVMVKLFGWLTKPISFKYNKHYFNEIYLFASFRALKQVWKLGKHAREGLAKIDIPYLECQAALDDTVNVKGVTKLLQQYVKNVEIKWFKGGHTMPLDEDAEAVKKEIVDFFCRAGVKNSK